MSCWAKSQCAAPNPRQYRHRRTNHCTGRTTDRIGRIIVRMSQTVAWGSNDDCRRAQLRCRTLGSLERFLVRAIEPIDTLCDSSSRRTDAALYAPDLVVWINRLLRTQRLASASADARISAGDKRSGWP